jgi:hypothetical protein
MFTSPNGEIQNPKKSAVLTISPSSKCQHKPIKSRQPQRDMHPFKSPEVVSINFTSNNKLRTTHFRVNKFSNPVICLSQWDVHLAEWRNPKFKIQNFFLSFLPNKLLCAQ